MISYPTTSRSWLRQEPHHGRNCAHPIEGKHFLSYRASDLNIRCCEGKKAKGLLCWLVAGEGLHSTFLLLWGPQEEARFHPGMPSVDNPACLNFMMALSNSQKLGFYVSMHGECHHQYYSELSLIRKFNCIALTWTEKLETPKFPENICVFRQHHCCSAERWRRGFTRARFDMCYLKMQRSLVLREEAHFQTGKWVHSIL